MAKEKITFYFPDDFEEASKFFGTVENLERVAGIEFSCGEGLFMSQLLAKASDVFSKAYEKDGYEAAMKSRANDETEAAITRLDGKVDENVINVYDRDNQGRITKTTTHVGKFKIKFDYDDDAEEKGKEKVTNMKVVLRW
jgi:hypothetical protein